MTQKETAAIESAELESLKKIVTKHLSRELDIFELVLKLNEDDARTFLKWYYEHQYVKGIKVVLEIVRRGKTQ